MEQTKNSGSEVTTDGFLLFFALIFLLPVLPVFFLAKSLLYCFQNLKAKKFLVFFVLAYFALLITSLLITLFNFENISDWVWINPIFELFFPQVAFIKIILEFFMDIIGSDVISVFLKWNFLASSNLILSGVLLVVFISTKKITIQDHKQKIKIYNEKLKNEEVIKNPSNLALKKRVWFWLLNIKNKDFDPEHQRIKELKKINPKDYVKLNNETYLPKSQLNKHVLIVGTTGTGKTETMLKFINSAIKDNKPVVFVDGKGDVDKVERIQNYCKEHNRKLKVFTISGQNIKINNNEIKVEKYNPFSSKEDQVLIDSIMSLVHYSEEHYKAGAQTYLSVLIQSLLATNKKVSFENIILYLKRDKLINLLKEKYNLLPPKKIDTNTDNLKTGVLKESKTSKPNHKLYNIDKTQLENIDKNSIEGFSSRISTYYNATKKSIGANGFTINQALKNNEVVVFSLNSLKYPEQVESMGKIILSDLKSQAEHNFSLQKRFLIALDEFDQFASKNIITILNKTRSKGFEVLLVFQSLGDLENVSRAFKSQIIENTNTQIIHKLNDPETRDFFLRAFGTKKGEKKTYVTDSSDLTGRESVRITDAFQIDPGDISSLKAGEVFIKYLNEEGEVVIPPTKIKILLD